MHDTEMREREGKRGKERKVDLKRISEEGENSSKIKGIC